MKSKFVVPMLSAFAFVVGASTAVFAAEATYTLPNETATLKASSDPGFEKAQTNCAICHSVDYISTQPPGKGRDFWAAEVKKMVGVYGCPVPAEDQAAIIDYLAKTY